MFWNRKAKPKKKLVPTPMIINHTSWLIQDIRKLEHIHTYKNTWRERTIELYKHPDNDTQYVTIGTWFDNSTIVVSIEDKEQYEYIVKQKLTHVQ